MNITAKDTLFILNHITRPVGEPGEEEELCDEEGACEGEEELGGRRAQLLERRVHRHVQRQRQQRQRRRRLRQTLLHG